MRAFIILCLIAIASAFKPMAQKRVQSVVVKATGNPGPTFWTGKAPPSSVLGIGEKIPSAIFGPFSLIALVVGTFCVHESNIFGVLSATSVNPLYVLGSSLVPISWGSHVAAWIQKQNGR